MNTSSSINPVVTLAANTQGTDYVVGDLHGCYAMLQTALEQVSFDPLRDRLFSVGDLVDRGPDSLKCLQLLEQPWFYAVIGNHELMLMDFFERYDADAALPSRELDCWFNKGQAEDLDDDLIGRQFLYWQNGGNWIAPYYDDERQRMTLEFDQALRSVGKLPTIIVVGEGSERFQVVHAELVISRARAAINVWRDEDIDRWQQGEPIPYDGLDRMFWGRSLFGMGDNFMHAASIYPGLSTTYCGHTIGQGVRKSHSHVCLDTGAFICYAEFDMADAMTVYGLTLLNTRTQQAIQIC